MSAGKRSRKMALGLGEVLEKDNLQHFHFPLSFISFQAQEPHLQFWVWLNTDPPTQWGFRTPSPRSEQAAVPEELALHPWGNCSGAGQLYKGWWNSSYCCNKGLSNKQGTEPGPGHPEGLKIKGWITQSSLSLSTPWYWLVTVFFKESLN